MAASRRATERTPKTRTATWRRGFLVGAICVAVAALLWMPRTGEELREWLAETYALSRQRLTGLMTGERPYPD